MRYFIRFSFNGAAYHGWQMQENAISVQSKMVEALHFKAGVEEILTGCGRTDTGVHARNFFAHFDLEKSLDVVDCEKLVFDLNSFLPHDIAVQAVFPVKADAHARFSAVSRTYKYYISREKDPFLHHFSWFVFRDIDIEKMNEAAASLFEYNDFTSFSKLHTDAKTNNCRIMQAVWEEEAGKLVFTITADRFLRNMVRAIVGTLIKVGRHQLTIENFKEIIEGKNRGLAGFSVPAQGLFLHSVEYNWSEILVSK